MNKALLAKVGWTFLKEEKDWVRIMKAKYLENGDKLEVIARESHLKASIIWNKMIKTRNTLSQGIKWKLGKGDKIRFWEDN